MFRTDRTTRSHEEICAVGWRFKRKPIWCFLSKIGVNTLIESEPSTVSCNEGVRIWGSGTTIFKWWHRGAYVFCLSVFSWMPLQPSERMARIFSSRRYVFKKSLAPGARISWRVEFRITTRTWLNRWAYDAHEDIFDKTLYLPQNTPLPISRFSLKSSNTYILRTCLAKTFSCIFY